MDRVPDYESVGCAFESRVAHQYPRSQTSDLFFLLKTYWHGMWIGVLCVCRRDVRQIIVHVKRERKCLTWNLLDQNLWCVVECDTPGHIVWPVLSCRRLHREEILQVERKHSESFARETVEPPGFYFARGWKDIMKKMILHFPQNDIEIKESE